MEVKKQGGSGQPWHIKEYITKRKRRQTNALGNIVDDDEDFLDPAGWDEDAKLKLAVDCVARELGVSQEHVTRRLEVLQKLVPDLKPKLRAMKIGDLARLAVKGKTIPHDLIELKDIFPLANVSRMVAAKVTDRPVCVHAGACACVCALQGKRRLTLAAFSFSRLGPAGPGQSLRCCTRTWAT